MHTVRAGESHARWLIEFHRWQRAADLSAAESQSVARENSVRSSPWYCVPAPPNYAPPVPWLIWVSARGPDPSEYLGDCARILGEHDPSVLSLRIEAFRFGAGDPDNPATELALETEFAAAGESLDRSTGAVRLYLDWALAVWRTGDDETSVSRASEIAGQARKRLPAERHDHYLAVLATGLCSLWGSWQGTDTVDPYETVEGARLKYGWQHPVTLRLLEVNRARLAGLGLSDKSFQVANDLVYGYGEMLGSEDPATLAALDGMVASAREAGLRDAAARGRLGLAGAASEKPRP